MFRRFLEGHVGADRHHVEIHQAPGGVLCVAQHRFEPGPFLVVERGEHLLDDVLGEILEQIRRIVRVDVLRNRRQRLRIEHREPGRAHRVLRLHEDFGVDSGIDGRPDHVARRGRQRLENERDLGWMQVVEQRPDVVERPCLERTVHAAEMLHVTIFLR